MSKPLSTRAELPTALADALKDVLAQRHYGKDSSTPRLLLQGLYAAEQELSRSLRETVFVVNDAEFRARLKTALDEICRDQKWDRARLALELGKSEKTVFSTWTDPNGTSAVPFLSVATIARWSGREVGWFCQEGGDLQRTRDAIYQLSERVHYLEVKIDRVLKKQDERRAQFV